MRARKSSIRLLNEQRSFKPVCTSAFAASLFGLFSFRLSHLKDNSYSIRLVKIRECKLSAYKNSQNDE